MSGIEPLADTTPLKAFRLVIIRNKFLANDYMRLSVGKFVEMG